ncbi:5-like isoform X2 [Octopus vulgaris]|uniref:5-like isoform X2 n=1 Tax=Octopus vulgaris TaxID=6645 RepID=A0AA36FNA7_OCTVU|nr:5-like isoform X2 [Octopus vulgaris]
MKSVREVQRLSSKIKRSAIAILTREDYSWELSFETDGDAEDWLNVVLLEHQKRGDAKFFTSPGIHKQIRSDLKADQYDVYPVCPMAYTPLGDFHGECLMVLTPETIHLLDAGQPTCCLATWQMKQLKKFQLNSRCLSLEVGKSCDSPGGSFVFSSIYSEDIFEQLRQQAHVFAQDLDLDSLSHSDSILSLDSSKSFENLTLVLTNNEPGKKYKKTNKTIKMVKISEKKLKTDEKMRIKW